MPTVDRHLSSFCILADHWPAIFLKLETLCVTLFDIIVPFLFGYVLSISPLLTSAINTLLFTKKTKENHKYMIIV